MIEFLRPGALWALPVAASPWVIHFWGRVRAQPTPFTALDLLREAAHTRFSLERLRHWILLALRTLLLVALILFLAKPGIRGALGSHEPGIILLDASFSLNATHSGQTAFERARTLARTVISGSPTDRWGLVIFSDRIEKAVPVEKDSQAILQALEKAEPTFRGTSYSVAFAEVDQLLKKGGTLLLLSDLAAHGGDFERIPGESVADALVAVEVVPQQPNAGIVGLTSGPMERNPHGEVWAGGETPVRTWTLRRNGRRIAQGPVRWDGGKGLVTLPPGPGDSELDLNPDSLSTDDRWFFVGDSEKPINGLLVNGAPSLSPVGDESYFIRPVLDHLSTQGIQFVGASPTDLATKDLSKTPVILLLNPPPLPSSTVARLTTYVENGGGLWITAGDRGGLQSFETVLPLSSLSAQEINDTLEWSETGLLSPLKGLAWGRVHVERGVTGSLDPGAVTVLRTGKSKTPLLSVVFRGKGRVALWGSTADRDWTNLPAKPAFPVMVGHLLRWLAENQEKETPFASFVGEPIKRTMDGEGPFSIRRPDGQVDPMARAGQEWIYENTNLPGFYELRGGKIETVAVNVRAEKEGTLARLNPDVLKARWNHGTVQWIPANKAQPENILNALQGRDLSPLLSRSIFVLMLLETLFLFLWWKKN